MSDSEAHDPAAACPVDHKSREAWMQQARAASASSSNNASASLPPDHPRIPTTAAGADAEESCPVDHKAREAWMQQARAASSSAPAQTAQPQQQSPPQPQQSSWTSGILSYLPFGGSSTSSSTTAAVQHHLQQHTPQESRLDTGRIISSIPRSGLLPPTTEGGPQAPSQHAAPANMEQETGADAASGNWIYPSEKMFFDAMKRKGHDPQAPDMRTIVPIHNAVNERAWAEIKQWEAPFYEKGSSCEGPRLSSFSGLSSKLSPKAKINTWLGYQAPFDRHDWVVDRCGQEIEYIIDFYTGRPRGDGKPSFYLDVRPKLNSWEGVKMRAMRGLGIMDLTVPNKTVRYCIEAQK
ncbi:Cytochrome c1 heme lyase [Neopestalotiopsis sp. 37M]|nr:Cytochrome c1 heme lyase [Neopestalotiopsis sp. 37M]